MSKHDWLVLFVRVCGLYFVVMHFSAFVTGCLGVAMFFNRQPPARLAELPWQFPIAAIIVLFTGMFLLIKADAVARYFESFDKK